MYADPAELVVFPDNHDMSRIFSQVNEDFDLYKMALGFVCTVRGVPQIYYGTEILMKNPGTDDHGIIRSDFPGGWAGDEINGFTGKGLTAQQLEAQNFVKKLLNWRKSASAIHHGKLTHFIPYDQMYVYFRYDEKQKVMVVLNKNDKSMSLSLERFAEMFDGEKQGTDVITGKVHTLGKSIDVAPKSVTILELK